MATLELGTRKLFSPRALHTESRSRARCRSKLCASASSATPLPPSTSSSPAAMTSDLPHIMWSGCDGLILAVDAPRRLQERPRAEGPTAKGARVRNLPKNYFIPLYIQSNNHHTTQPYNSIPSHTHTRKDTMDAGEQLHQSIQLQENGRWESDGRLKWPKDSTVN